MTKNRFQSLATALLLVMSTATALVSAPASAPAQALVILMADNGGQFYRTRLG
jgi:hypothetical protein